MNKREKFLKIVQALSQKTTLNGCTEKEALAAAEKLETLMKKYGLDLKELETVDAVKECEESHITYEKQLHPVFRAAAGIADFTDTQTWYYNYRHRIGLTYFGLPGDVRVATHLTKIIAAAMDQEWSFFWAVNSGRTEVPPSTARKGFMSGMAHRISQRLRAMKTERQTQNNDCKAIVLRKADIVEAGIEALGYTFRKGSGRAWGIGDYDSFIAGDAAGSRAPLNEGELQDVSA
jgi:hypothetical protein